MTGGEQHPAVVVLEQNSALLPLMTDDELQNEAANVMLCAAFPPDEMWRECALRMLSRIEDEVRERAARQN